MAKTATRESYGNALVEYGKDERIVVLDADLSKSNGTGPLYKKFPALADDLFAKAEIDAKDRMDSYLRLTKD